MNRALLPSSGQNKSYLNSLFVDGKLVKVENGSFDDIDGRKDSHAYVDGITPLRIQNEDF